MSPAQSDPQREALARLLRHPVRAQALLKYAESPTSPSAIAAALGSPLNVVSYHTQVLLRAGAIELVGTERRRGASEHFYRATLAGEIEDAQWRELPAKLRRVLARVVIDGVMRESADALADGGMDDASTHLSRNYLVLDERGERELASLLRDIVVRARAMGAGSRERAGPSAVDRELVVMSFRRASSL